MRSLAFVGVSILLVACASIKQYQTVQQPIGRDLQTYVGGTIVRTEKEESLPNAFGGAEGFEPSNTGSKGRRLTAWPRPNTRGKHLS